MSRYKNENENNVQINPKILSLVYTQTVTVQFVMYVQCAQNYCNTKCVAVRTHRYRPSQYNLLCTFSVHNVTVTHNVFLSEHTVTDLHSTICYVRSVCTTLL